MSLSRFARPNERKRKASEGKVDYFDLLGLPNEMITLAFSFLDMKDRMRARLNKRLFKIEAGSKYFVKDMRLAIRGPYTNGEYYVYINGKLCDFRHMRKIASNTSIGALDIFVYERPHIFFPPSYELRRKFCGLIKEFRNIGELILRFENKIESNKAMVNRFFIDLPTNCKSLNLRSIGNVSPDALYQVYKSISLGSTCTRFTVEKVTKNMIRSFLLFLGITYRDGEIFSSRNIEAYIGHEIDNWYFIHFFDELCELQFCVYEIEEHFSNLRIELHKNLESVENEKKGMEIIEVYPM